TSVRQGELVHTPQRLALRFPIVTAFAPTLPLPRQERLRETLAEAGNLWSLVRLGISWDTNPAAVRAEIDLTGAPSCALEPLISAGLAALRNAVAGLVGTVEILTDATVASAALDSTALSQLPTKELS